MSKSSALRKAVAAAVVEPTQYELGEGHKLAVEFVVAQENLIQQQQSTLMQRQLEMGKRKTALIAEIEKTHGIPQGSILGGTWSVIDGVLIKQKKSE
jgi:hypothetical protein